MKRFGLLATLVIGLTSLWPALATDWSVDSAHQLRQVLSQASAGDRITLTEGTYTGSFLISVPVLIRAQGSVQIDAQGTGNALSIQADDVTIDGLNIRGWGSDLTETDAAIKAVSVNNLTVRNTLLQGDGFGIYLENVNEAQIEHNRVQGNPAMRSADRGNGIHLISSQQIVVDGNRVSDTRDGLYIINSQHNRLVNNQMRNLRFGIHYMYSHANTVEGNVAQNVDVGYALMSSHSLAVSDNVAQNCRDYGLLLNFVNRSEFVGNRLESIRSDTDGQVVNDEGKALFVYNSGQNLFRNNLLADSDLGIHLTAGSEGNRFTENRFVHNRVQVKYVSSREQEWSVDGRGNYWSNYLGWDLDSDGIGDAGFEPNDDMDKLMWTYPEAEVLMDSPAVLLLRWVQRNFPVLKSPGVRDSYPLYQLNGVE
ncbi:nitrous oxide reductase family maturation protein NosD [Reinekea blandensis]|uniref:Hypothetical NosD, Nitrous oxidase accessory protein n=1 Tax=Reinekea blandensis MED297 TaxID=314283 RepID=A4BIK3_9GAMM|nr:nitrous oxide reductase family maturation protein NosD [Reinekea blandensis]EAR08082.1 hypothetical NosD, Nitrous oxidase accessory protein [Reinekea sp. MED297] [Reinekea blandensis MED297]